MFQVRIVRQIRVDPVAESKLLLQSDRVRGPLARRLGDSTQRLQILLLRDDLFERGSQFVRFQLLAKFLELLEGQSALVLRPLFVVVLLDHLTDLVAGHFEATDVQSASQLCEVDEAVPILVDLTENQAPLDLDGSFRRFEDVSSVSAGFEDRSVEDLGSSFRSVAGVLELFFKKIDYGGFRSSNSRRALGIFGFSELNSRVVKTLSMAFGGSRSSSF